MVDVTNVDIGGTVSGITGGISKNIIYIELFVVLVVILVIVLFVRHMLSFKHLVIVEEKLNHGTLVSAHRGKIGYNKKYDVNKIVERLQIYGVKDDIMIPIHMAEQIEQLNKIRGVEEKKSYVLANKDKFENLFGITRKGKIAIRMMKDGNEFTVIPWVNEDVSEYLKESLPVRKQWTQQMLRERDEMFKPPTKAWLTLLPFIAIGVILVTMIIIFALLFNKFDKLENLANAEMLDAESRIVMASAIANNTDAIRYYATVLDNFANNKEKAANLQVITG